MQKDSLVNIGGVVKTLAEHQEQTIQVTTQVVEEVVQEEEVEEKKVSKKAKK